jgi:hypothetical protein
LDVVHTLESWIHLPSVIMTLPADLSLRQ